MHKRENEQPNTFHLKANLFHKYPGKAIKCGKPFSISLSAGYNEIFYTHSIHRLQISNRKIPSHTALNKLPSTL